MIKKNQKSEDRDEFCYPEIFGNWFVYQVDPKETMCIETCIFESHAKNITRVLYA